MKELKAMSKQELELFLDEERRKYDEIKRMGMSLDMSRGKPGNDQLSLSNDMLTILGDGYKDDSGLDCRNYGGLDGLPSMKKILADILCVSVDEVIINGNSSLSTMFDNIAANMTHGVRDGEPWAKQGKIKFICPSPGYDRHFAICEYFLIDMISVRMLPTGPDMDEVERLVSSDPMIKGMWCTPKYSNPDGISYSDETVKRLAALKPAANDFRIYWDDAYTIHHLYDEPEKQDRTLNILRECENAGNPNMVYIFTSFSKISFSGAAVAAMASSKSNVEYIKKRMSVQTIGPDKLNQLKHVRFFKDFDNVKEHMRKHASILRPKFELVLDTLDRELGELGICTYNRPRGGYFVSFFATKGCAKKIVSYCKEAGLTLTTAGATYPYGNDPDDSNIRIAPSFPSLDELKKAIEVFCVCVKLATAEAYQAN